MGGERTQDEPGGKAQKPPPRGDNRPESRQEFDRPMTQNENVAPAPAPVEEIQQRWHELNLRVGQLEAARNALEQENKALRFLLERVVEHRQKSHNELVLILTALVSKLPLNDVGVIVAKLVEHNT